MSDYLLTPEEEILLEPLHKKFYATAIAVGETLAKTLSTKQHLKSVNKLVYVIQGIFIVGMAIGYIQDIQWLIYLSGALGLSYGSCMYAYEKVMKEKIERLFDKVDILLIDWEVEFGDTKSIYENLTKHHMMDAGADAMLNTCTKDFDMWWTYHKNKINQRRLSRERANEILERELADIESRWEK